MVLLVAAAFVGSVVIAVLVSWCYAMFQDVAEAQEELHERIIQMRRGSRTTSRPSMRFTTGISRTDGSCRKSLTE